MKNLNFKKALLCIVLSLIGVVILDIVIHAILLKQTWINSSKYWLSPEIINKLVPVAWFLLLIGIKIKGSIFIMFLPHNLKSGLVYGILIGSASAFGALGLLTFVPWPKSLVLGIASQQLLGDVLMGIIFGIFYRPRQI